MSKNRGYSKNIELLGFHDLKDRPGFQMAMQVVDGRYYLYVSHFRHSDWTVMEVTDPEKPRFIRFIEGPQLSGQVTNKIQVADGLMIGALATGIPFLHKIGWDDPYIAGVHIFDVKEDPENPKFLSFWNAGEPKPDRCRRDDQGLALSIALDRRSPCEPSLHDGIAAEG